MSVDAPGVRVSGGAAPTVKVKVAGAANGPLPVLLSVAVAVTVNVPVWVGVPAIVRLVAVVVASLGERRRELAILRALGASPMQIFALLALESDKPLPEEAGMAREAWLNAGGIIHAPDIVWPEDVDLIVDGLLGTGLRSAPRENR